MLNIYLFEPGEPFIKETISRNIHANMKREDYDVLEGHPRLLLLNWDLQILFAMLSETIYVR